MITIRNYIVVLLLSTSSFISNLYAQPKVEKIKSIKMEFQAINSDSTLKKVKLENEEFLGEDIGDGGGELIGFYKGQKIKKIYKRLFFSSGIEIKEYYFKDGQLIFVYYKFSAFGYDEKKGERDFNKIKTTFEGRYYFYKQKLIEQVLKGENRGEDESSDPEKVLIEQANENLKLLNKKK